MQLLSAILIPFLFLLGIVQAAPLEKRLTRSKLDQFSATHCGGKNSDKSSHQIDHRVAMDKGDCVDIDGRTHSIYLSRGRGMYSRTMTAYAQTGCPANQRIDKITEHESGSACMNVDTQLIGVAGSEEHQGRIMSVKFT